MIGLDSVGCFDCVLTVSVSFNGIVMSSFVAIKLDIMLSFSHVLRKVPLVYLQSLRATAEQISDSLRLLRFFPMHSDSQPFVNVAI